MRLHEALEMYFNLDEVKSLCFDIGVDYESLSTDQSKVTLVRELVSHLIRRNELPNLIAECARLRPGIEWKHLDLPKSSTDRASASGSIRAGGSITAGESISATGSIDARESIQAGGSITAGDSITAGE